MSQRRAGRQVSGVAALVAGSAILAACLLLPTAPGGAASATATLDDDAGGLALFSGSAALSPGVTRTACLSLAATTAKASDLVAMTANRVSGALAPHVIIDIDLGTGGVYGDCSDFVADSGVFRGTLADLAAAPGDGVPTGWYPATLRVASFRIAVTADVAARPNGATAEADFVWRLVAGAVAPPTPAPTPTTPSDNGPSTPVETAVPTPRPTTTPTSTPTPSMRPTSSSSVPPSPGTATPTGGFAGRGSTGTPTRPDLTLTPPLAQRAWNTALAALQTPQFTLGPLLLALAFLLLQQWIDMRDPKLANAARTRRELLLDFHVDYHALTEETP